MPKPNKNKKIAEALYVLTSVTITEPEIANYYRDTERLKELKKTVSRLEKDIDKQDQRFLDYLATAYANTREPVLHIGKYLLKKLMVMPQCRPSWKEVFMAFVRSIGLNAEAEVLKVEEVTRKNLTAKPNIEVEQLTQ